MDTLYRHLLKPLLFAMNPDTAHAIFMWIGEFSGRFYFTRKLFARIYGYRGPDISKTIDGIHYRTPVLLSAGFDTNGSLTRILPSLSFGGEEIGSITAHYCEGNPKPRMIRMPRNQSIVVFKGLRNKGVDALIEKLSHTNREKNFVLGISIARTNNSDANKSTEASIEDFAASFRKLNAANIGDYYTINISCPNAFGGETFTEPQLLTQLLTVIMSTPSQKPIYLKMPINLEWEQFNALLKVADKFNVHGVVIGNLNKEYGEVDFKEDCPTAYRGGLSGKPCRERSTTLIRLTRETYGKRFTIFGVGGILSPGDAMEKFAAGADLVQLISGMIFSGPGLVNKICETYASKNIQTT
ncbi:MAG TPA: quinone-dependent dihydroorotate dehydrogenase [Candidatus Paceibacterota bacterium]|nr:quinone-dependent dihydroorotate dehydrogenase [Candidatus Paceibacterota bacterium]